VEVCLITTGVEVDSDVMEAIKTAYAEDRLFGPVITNPERYPAYSILDGLIYHNEQLCIPSDRTVGVMQGQRGTFEFTSKASQQD